MKVLFEFQTKAMFVFKLFCLLFSFLRQSATITLAVTTAGRVLIAAGWRLSEMGNFSVCNVVIMLCSTVECSAFI